MQHKLTIPIVIVVSLLLGGCMKLPEEPPLLADSATPNTMPAASSLHG